MKCHIVIATIALFFGGGNSLSADCSNAKSNLDDVHYYFQRALDEKRLEDKQDYARKAKNALEDLSASVSACGCDKAVSEFEEASYKAKAARDSDDPIEFAENLQKSVKLCGHGIDELHTCFPRKGN